MSKCNWCGEHTSDPLSFDNYEEEFCSMRCFDQFLTRGYKPTKRSGCFVATACLGDYNHPVVLDLRRFRDEFLKEKLGVGNSLLGIMRKDLFSQRK